VSTESAVLDVPLRRRLRALVTARRGLIIVGLVVAWCALWESVSVANILSGTLVAIMALWIVGSSAGSSSIRIGPLAKFIWMVLVDLVTSTVQVVWEILTPTDHTDEAIIAVRVLPEARSHLLLLVVAVTVTPGTAVVDADPDNGTLYLHLLHSEHADRIVEHVQHLAALACRAFPLPGEPRKAAS
jgi:multicomponent Na+:H+ antiporter subunit E